MAEHGLLDRITRPITGLLGNPVVQGVGGAAALGFNPLLGLLAVPGLQSDRERRAFANEGIRNRLLQQKRESEAMVGLRGLLADQTIVQGPGTSVPGFDETINIPGRKALIPTVNLPGGNQQRASLLAQFDPTAAVGLVGTSGQEFKTDIGKLFSDLDLAENQGNTAAVTAIRSTIQSKLSPGVNFDDVRATRNDVIRNSQGFLEAQAGFQRVETGFAAVTPAGDLAGIFGFMKVLDPGSTVREGEFANVQNTGSIPTRLWGLYNRILRGERLTQDQRFDFRSQARKQFEKVLQQQNKLLDDAREFAKRNGLTIADVLPDFLVPAALPELPDQPAARGGLLTGPERRELNRLRRELGLGGT